MCRRGCSPFAGCEKKGLNPEPCQRKGPILVAEDPRRSAFPGTCTLQRLDVYALRCGLSWNLGFRGFRVYGV